MPPIIKKIIIQKIHSGIKSNAFNIIIFIFFANVFFLFSKMISKITTIRVQIIRVGKVTIPSNATMPKNWKKLFPNKANMPTVISEDAKKL